jgi:cytochrome c oxidase subunit II
MRGFVRVVEPAAFDAWRNALPTFAAQRSAAAADPLARGRELAQSKACLGCHSTDGSPSVGPTWKGLFGKRESLEGGGTVQVDEAFLREFIRNPQSRDIKGFPNVMPPIPLADEELDALVGFIKAQR